MKNSKLKITGHLEAKVFRHTPEGKILEQTLKGENLVVISGLNLVKALLNNEGSNNHLTKFKVGTGTTPVDFADTNLEAPVVIAGGEEFKAADSIDSSADGVLVITLQLSTLEANGHNLTEAGLFAENGTLFARRVLSTPIPKTDSNTVLFTWTLTISSL